MVRRFEKLEKVNDGEPDYLFDCPGCGCHHGVWTQSRNSMNAVWHFNGNIEFPTISPSVLVTYECAEPPVTPENYEEYIRKPWKQVRVKHICHSFIRNGYIEYLNDCTHKLAGQTILLPEI
ncbi:MAG: hypothetical protein L6Q66_01955 [Bacteroidia bacterium]|nr:hypothetical protein [Bacteroidia bacterium]